MVSKNTERDDTTVEVSCGNVFEDLGLPDADELQTKARLVYEIRRAIKERGLTQSKAAKLLGVAQPDISNVLRGRITGFSSERLLRFLVALGNDVEIIIKPLPHKDRETPCGKISVVAL